MSGQLPEGARVGVVGGPAVAESVAAAGGDPTVGDATAVVDAAPDAVLAVGEQALVDLVAAGVEAPVLPVSGPDSVWSVPESAVESAVESLLAGEFEAVTYPLLAADVPGPARPGALFDLTLVTDAPARISEYTVLCEGATVSTFRADGVVVATPAGSTGYAHAAGGPVLAPDTGVVAVVPIAPFATDTDHWALPEDGVGLVVERDETPVHLLVDGRDTGPVTPGRVVPVSTRGSLSVAVVAESVGRFG